MRKTYFFEEKKGKNALTATEMHNAKGGAQGRDDDWPVHDDNKDIPILM